MRGEILHYSDGEGRGYIVGDDKERYEFSPADMKQLRSVTKGARVDFRAEGSAAREIFVLEEEAGAAAGREPDLPPNHPSTRHHLGNPFDYFKKCMTLYADGKGRAGVAEYWSFVLVSVLLALVPLALLVVGFDWDRPDPEPNAIGILALVVGAIIYLGLIIPGTTVSIRRLHDLGLSGWWYVGIFVSSFFYAGSIIMFVISVIPSSGSTNQHGPSPKARVDEVFA